MLSLAALTAQCEGLETTPRDVGAHVAGVDLLKGRVRADHETRADQQLGLTAAGIALGIAASLLLTRVMSGLLFGVRATDPATYAAVSAVLAAVALLATDLPARRAARVDPVVALRAEG